MRRLTQATATEGPAGFVQVIVAAGLLAIAALLLAVVVDLRGLGERIETQARMDNGAAAAATVQAWALDLNAVMNIAILSLHATEAGLLLGGTALSIGQLMSGVGAPTALSTLNATADLVHETWELNKQTAAARDQINRVVVPPLTIAAAIEGSRQGARAGLPWPVLPRGEVPQEQPTTTRDCIEQILNPEDRADRFQKAAGLTTAGSDLQVDEPSPGAGLAALIFDLATGRRDRRGGDAQNRDPELLRRQIDLDEAVDAWRAALGEPPWWPELVREQIRDIPEPEPDFAPAVDAQCALLRNGVDADAWRSGLTRVRRALRPLDAPLLDGGEHLSQSLAAAFLPTLRRGDRAPSLRQAWAGLQERLPATGATPFHKVEQQIKRHFEDAAGGERLAEIDADLRVVLATDWIDDARAAWLRTSAGARDELAEMVCDELTRWKGAVLELPVRAEQLVQETLDLAVRGAMRTVQAHVDAVQQAGMATDRGREDAPAGASLFERIVARAFCRVDTTLLSRFDDVPMPTRLRDDFATSQIDAVWMPAKVGVGAVAQAQPWARDDTTLPGETILWPGFAPRWMPVDVHRRVSFLPSRLQELADALLQH